MKQKAHSSQPQMVAGVQRLHHSNRSVQGRIRGTSVRELQCAAATSLPDAVNRAFSTLPVLVDAQGLELNISVAGALLYIVSSSETVAFAQISSLLVDRSACVISLVVDSKSGLNFLSLSQRGGFAPRRYAS